MYTLILIIILIIAAIALRVLYVLFKSRISFFITGLDAGFSLKDLIMLWNVATVCELEEPNSLFYSMNSLSRCMTKLTVLAAEEGTEGDGKNQKLLSKLFDYRTKLQNVSDEKKGVSNTRELDKGQKLRIVFPGKGVYSSKILNIGNHIIISVPKQNNLITITAEEWVGRPISVYFWRNGDARYVFDTEVLQSGLFIGEPALYLKHSAELLRTQKRKSIRVPCEILGSLFLMKKDDADYTAIETRNGYKCLIQDISESGALIKIGGKGIAKINIKIQYSLNNKLIVMYGVIRTVEYNEEKNQSLLHFECTHIEPVMKNEILSFVYNTLPTEEKEALEALSQTELDSAEDQENNENSEEKNETVIEKLEANAENEANKKQTSDDIINNIMKEPIDDEDIDDDIEEIEEIGETI